MGLIFKLLCALAIALLATGDGADAIECYSCVSGVGSGCDDPFDANGSGVTTSTSCNSCLKTKTGSSVVRSCSPLALDDCVDSSGSTVCSCTGNLCNGAQNHMISLATTVSMFGLLAVVKLFL